VPPATARYDGPAAQARIGFALGVSQVAVRDDIVCPLRWDGPGVRIGIAYDRLGRVDRHRVDFVLPVGFLTDRYGHRTAAGSFRLSYSYLREAATFGRHGALYAGALVGGNMDLEVYAEWDDEHLYWIIAYDLAAAGQYELRVSDRHELTLGLALPLVSLVSRPPLHRYYKTDHLDNFGFYFSKSHENLRVVSLDKHLALAGSIRHRFAVSEYWGLGIEYEFYYRRYTRPETIRMASHSISLRVSHDL
jgi:hypothetical protein